MADISSFPVRSSEISLGNSPVMICYADMIDLTALDNPARLLSVDELTRASRLRLPALQKRWTAVRALLRQLLGCLLQIKPEKVAFKYGENGKPALLASDSTLKFNLSHSGNQVLYAFSREKEIGVDIEEIHPVSDLNAISRQFFSEAENKLLEKSEHLERTEKFFQIWTLKEAVLKAVGTGFTFPSNQFSVLSVNVDSVSRNKNQGECAIQGRRVSTAVLSPLPGFPAALAVLDS